MVNTESLREQFRRQFDNHDPHLIVRAPGRVNLIGEHTDYNDGFVLPIAMRQSLFVAAKPRDDRRIRVHSRILNATVDWSLDEPIRPGSPSWGNYCKGVAALLIQAGIEIRGADLLLDGDLPAGGGLSSSAALEVGTAKALLALNDQMMPTADLAALCRRAEHEFANSPCGIMDQFICLFGRAAHALLIDCRSLQYDHIPFHFDGVSTLVINTQVKHDLASSEYPTRQQQCRKAAEFFRTLDPSVHALRDVSEDMLDRHSDRMDRVVANRARHVIRESHRVLHAVETIKAGAIHELGRLMVESHNSLKKDYEVSCTELDTLVDIAERVEGVYGARMTGGGFGGCVVALVETPRIDALLKAINENYNTRFAKPALALSTQASDGADWYRL